MDETQPPPPGIGLVATVDREVWLPGALITGILAVSNTAAEGQLVLRTGSPAIGRLSTPAGMPVGNDGRPCRGVGRTIDLAPGDTTELPFICGSSALDLPSRATLPPGDYLLVVHLRIPTEDNQDLLAAPPVPIRLESA